MADNELILNAIAQTIEETGIAGTETHAGRIYTHVVLTDSETKFNAAFVAEEDGHPRVKFCRIGRSSNTPTSTYPRTDGHTFADERSWEYEIMLCRAYSEDGSARHILERLADLIVAAFDTDAVRDRFSELGAALDPLEQVLGGLTSWKNIGGVTCETIQASLTVRVQP